MNDRSLQFPDHPPIAFGPIQALAPELLIAIFEHIADSDGEIFAPDILSISHVCNLWRKVALATPSLWTSIDLRYSGFQTFAARSLLHPVKLSLIEDDARGWVHIDDLQDMVSRLMGLLIRAESLTVECSTVLMVALLDSPAPFHLPELRCLHLGCSKYSTQIPTFEHSAPNLKQLHLTAVTMNLSKMCLTSFKLERVYQGDRHCPSSLDIAQLLERSPSMRHFHLLSL